MCSPPSATDRAQLFRRWEAGAVLLVLGLHLAAIRPFYGRAADDAYISFRYADNWARGCGPRYNCGEPPVEGYTNFLWVAGAALAITLGQDVVPAMRQAGLLCGMAALVLLFFLARRVNRHPVGQLFGPLILGSSPFFAVNTVSCLETPAFVATVLLAALLTLEARTRRRAGLAGLAWGVCALVRPEGLLLGAISVLWAGLAGGTEPGGPPEPWRVRGARGAVRGISVAAGLLLVAGPHLLWRLWYYGDLLPNTFHAKRDLPTWQQLVLNVQILEEHAFFWTALLVAALAGILARLDRRKGYLLLLAACQAAVSLSVHNNFWMPGHRLYLVAAAMLSVLAGGLGDLPRPGLTGLRRALAPMPLLLLAGAFLFADWHTYPKIKWLADLHYAADNHPISQMAERIRRLANPGDWLAIRDAGMLPFLVGGKVKVIDIHEHSLNDRTIARKGWDLRYILGHNPRFYVFPSHRHQFLWLSHPIEGRIFHMPGFRDNYRHLMTIPWHQARHFFLFLRVD